MKRGRAFAAGLFALLPLACDGLGHAGERPAGTRQVELNVPLEFVASLGNQVTAIQLAAAVVDGSAGLALHTSPAVDPTAQRLLIGYFPAADSFVPLVQSQGPGGADAPGKLLARIRFADGRGNLTSLVPRGDRDLDLGTPRFEGSAAAPAGSWLTVDDSHNPLLVIDSDGDGTSDLVDTDDDGDATPDSDDTDVDGDGRLDQQQSLVALPDADADAIPDPFE